MSKFARSDEPTVNQVQMNAKACKFQRTVWSLIFWI
jgi:hypothetical protein